MSTLDLDAIRARADAATPGPWIGLTYRKVLAGLATSTGGHFVDAPFIRHAREDVPALLAEVERLRAVARDDVGVPVEYAYAEGYAAAVTALRDEERYSNWWTSTGVQPTGTVRQHLADYLEVVGPGRRATEEDAEP